MHQSLLASPVDALKEDADRGYLIALSDGHEKPPKYPAWQFDDINCTAIRKVFMVLTRYDAWGKYLFFTQIAPLLDARTPLCAIQQGHGEEVLEVVKILNIDD